MYPYPFCTIHIHFELLVCVVDIQAIHSHGLRHPVVVSTIFAMRTNSNEYTRDRNVPTSYPCMSETHILHNRLEIWYARSL